MKLLGVISVMLASSAIALSLIAREKCNLCCLGTICLVLELIRAELSTRLCPMQTLLADALAAAEGETAAFLASVLEGLDSLQTRSFAEIWREAVENELKSLSEEEKGAMSALGASLGRYELQEQLTSIDRCLHQMQAAHEAGRRALPDKRRVIVALSETAGLFLCLLLI